MRETEVLVVGAGPIGIELSVALKKNGIDYVHVEAKQIGSTIAWYAAETRFFSSPERIAIAGVPLLTRDQSKATREEYLNYLRSVVDQFDLDIRTYERVIELRRVDDHFEVETLARGRNRYRAKKVVLAIGDMHRPRLIQVPGEGLDHVSHFMRDPHDYFRKKVAIVGGKNSAVEAAIRCFRVGADVTLIHRGDEFDDRRVKFWLLPEIRSLIRNRQIAWYPRTRVRAITELHVALESIDSGEESEIDADFVLLLTGYEQDKTLFEKVGVELGGEGRKPVFERRTMETNVPGLYVAGTASAGTQMGGVRVFIENSHVHVDRIVAALKGTPLERIEAPEYDLPES